MYTGKVIIFLVFTKILIHVYRSNFGNTHENIFPKIFELEQKIWGWWIGQKLESSNFISKT